MLVVDGMKQSREIDLQSQILPMERLLEDVQRRMMDSAMMTYETCIDSVKGCHQYLRGDRYRPNFIPNLSVYNSTPPYDDPSKLVRAYERK